MLNYSLKMLEYVMQPDKVLIKLLPSLKYGDVPFKHSNFLEQIIFSKYATNLKTTISKRSLRHLGLLLLLLEFNNFSFFDRYD